MNKLMVLPIVTHIPTGRVDIETWLVVIVIARAVWIHVALLVVRHVHRRFKGAKFGLGFDSSGFRVGYTIDRLRSILYVESRHHWRGCDVSRCLVLVVVQRTTTVSVFLEETHGP